jgi:hypothetical protein
MGMMPVGGWLASGPGTIVSAIGLAQCLNRPSA